MSDFITIPLSKKGKHAGKYEAIVHDEDKDLAESSWSVHRKKKTAYAHRVVKDISGRMVNVYLHQVILERILGRKLEKGEIPDHINGDGLDNRRENIRLATTSQNIANSKLRSTNTSGYRGVSFNKAKGKYMACIEHKGKAHNLGYYNNPEEAHEAYKARAKEIFGEFAKFD